MVKTKKIQNRTENVEESTESTVANNSEGEQKTDKSIFSKGRHKRLSNAVETTLPILTESDEKNKLMKSLSKNISEISNFDKYNENNIESASREDIGETNTKLATKDEETRKKNGINKQQVTYKDEVQNRKVCHGYEPECEGLFEKEMNTAELTQKSNVDQVNKKEGNKSGVTCEKSIKSRVIIPKLELNSLSSDTDSSDMKQIDGIKSKCMHTNDSFKNMDILTPLPDLKHTCVHGSINLTPRKGETLYQTVEQGRTPRKCILCDINGASFKLTKNVHTDVDKLLVEIVYPHDYYDRYSRAGKKSNETKEKEVISICQQAKVLPKPKTQRRMSPVLSAPATTPECTERGDPEAVSKIREVETGEIENEDDKEKTAKHVQYLYAPRENMKTEFHGHCGSKLKALVITEHTEGERGVLKGMKGLLVHKDVKSSPKDMKRSEYNISSLGIQFSLPEYNTSLRSRKEPSSRPGTEQTAYTPRQAEPYLPLAYGMSPRQHMLTSTPRRAQHVPTDDTGSVAPVPSVEDVVKSFNTQRSQYSVDLVKNSSTGSVSAGSSQRHKHSTSTEKSHLTLPPIPLAARSSPLRSALSSIKAGPITLAGVTLL